MSEEGMIPNEDLQPEEPKTPEVEQGEVLPEAEAQETAEEAHANLGDEDAKESSTEAENSKNEEEPELPVISAEAEQAESANESSEEPNEDAEEQVDAFPDAGMEDLESDEVSEDEQDALFDNTGDSAHSLLQEILGDHTNFDSIVEKAEPKELLLLMETIAERGKVSEFAQKVMAIRKSFDKKIDLETAEKALVSGFQTAFAKFNKKRATYYAEREKEKEANSLKKRELLEQLKQIVADEQVTKIQEVRDIQNKWREIGWVAQKDLQNLAETYRQYLDVFYNLRGKYNELVDYDRKVNLEEKKKLIDEIEALIPSEEGLSREEWTARSAKLKAIQENWRTLGLVPKDNLEEINGAYKNVLERFYELRNSYFELQDQQKGENATAKRELLEKLKGFLEYTADKAKSWNEATRKVLAMQEDWKKIGPGPLEENKQLWKEYRHICDTFFANKGNYFKGFDDQRNENLRLKTEICEKAEAMKESTDWKEGARILKELQEEWKKIGAVHERHSNKIWKRFRSACDSFFERRNAASSSEKNSLEENLKTKEALIAKLEALVAEDSPSSDAFQEIQTEWKATGHVPFKQKDKVNNAFRELMGKFFDKNRNSRHDYQKRNFEAELSSIPNGDERVRRLQGEIRKLRTRVQEVDGKVGQYEINVQYISKGKSGDVLRNQIQSQIDAEKAKLKELKSKIKEIQSLIDNPPAAENPVLEPEGPSSDSETAEA